MSAVDHPQHYTSHPSGIECIQITECLSFNLGNAVKYAWRASLKGGLQDLEKAAWYLRREAAYAASLATYRATVVRSALGRSPGLIDTLAKVAASEPCPFPQLMSPLAWLATALADFLRSEINTATFFGVVTDALQEAIDARAAGIPVKEIAP